MPTGTVGSTNEQLIESIKDDEQGILDKVNRQTEEIENEVKLTQPLLSDKEPVSGLQLLYDEVSSAEYFQKSKELALTYKYIRRVRGDGNCFYRAFLCAQLESLLSDRDELLRFTALSRGWRNRLIRLGFPEFTTGDFCDWFNELLEKFIQRELTVEGLIADLNEDGPSNYYVCFMRLITSGYLRENSVFYEGFIEGGRTVEQFCRDEIEPMWKDSDHLAIIALTNATGVSIRIEYMDRTAAPNGGWHHDFLVGEGLPRLYFLYRPGHYDILYKD